MKEKKFVLSFAVICLFLISMTVQDDGRKDKVLIEAISQGLKTQHYLNKDINDEFSRNVYGIYLEHLDFSKRFFIQSDIEKLNLYKEKIDDQILNESYQFFDSSYVYFTNRFKSIERYIKEILANPINFDVDESIEFDGKKLKWAKDTVELKDIWRKSLKYQVLLRLNDLIQIQDDALLRKDTVFKQKSLAQLEADARKSVSDNYRDFVRRINQLNRNDYLAQYYNAITNSYDPHTEYYPPKQKQDFDIAMTGKLEGIGAQLQESNGYVKVAQIVPGSASWKQGELKAGDIILKVAQGNKEPVSIVDMRLDDAVLLIRGKKGTEVRLTVKKVDETIKVISIIRDEVVYEESYAKSAVLIDKDKKSRIGFILLPSFYVDFKDRNGRHASLDIAKEVLKLNQENIDGLVIDLRNNGGGSLQDVVDIAGLFIESGPIVQVKSRFGLPVVLRDRDNKQILYKGPLVIMVNEGSASASEILSAAIQDYKRGLIVGSPTTYGKGTVQHIFDFDDILPENLADVKPLGSLKLTIQKYYRITGGATQLKGVESDIVFPGPYTYLKFGEKEQDYAMPWDEISPVAYQKFNSNWNFDLIKKNSLKRIKECQDFKLIDDNAKRMKKIRDISNITLNLKKYREIEKQRKEETKKYLKIGTVETGIDVASCKADNIQEANDLIKNRFKAWHNELKKDIYIHEVINIIKDMNHN